MSALPNTSSVPLAVRVFAISTTAPIFSRIAIAGSRFETASTCPLVIAAITPADVPTPMIDTSSPLRPSFASRCRTMRFVLDPGALTPIFRPFRSFGDL